MTTIAYRDGVLAADTMMTRGNEPVFGVAKVFRTKHFLIGVSGSFVNALPMLDLIEDWEAPGAYPPDLWRRWEDAPDFQNGMCAIIVDEYGGLFSIVDSPPVHIPVAFDAIGSGACYAMGAMGMGASAAEAVRVAKKFDVNTGGNILKVSFDG